MEKNELDKLKDLRIRSFILHTNEGLDAIVAGLNIRVTDSVLAICGSGDQAFAMLEFAKDVIAIDNDRNTLEYAVFRKKLLEERDFDCFLSKDEKQKTGYIKGINDAEYAEVMNYFTHQRLEAIRSKLVNFGFREGDVFTYLESNQNRFSRVYLSNVLTYGDRRRLNVQTLNKIAGMSSLGTLVYVSVGYELDAPARQAALRGLEIDKELTAIARDKEESRLARCYDEKNSAHKLTPVVLRVV